MEIDYQCDVTDAERSEIEAWVAVNTAPDVWGVSILTEVVRAYGVRDDHTFGAGADRNGNLPDELDMALATMRAMER